MDQGAGRCDQGRGVAVEAARRSEGLAFGEARGAVRALGGAEARSMDGRLFELAGDCESTSMSRILVIVREAGGFIEPLRKGGDILADGEVICGNEAIFDKFAGVIRG